MITPANYPHSTTYLRSHMARVSRGFVVLGLAIVAWLVFIAVSAGAYNFIVSLS